MMWGNKVFLVFALTSLVASQVIPPTDSNIYFSGRTQVSSNGAAVVYDWPGVQFEFWVSGAKTIYLIFEELMPTVFYGQDSASWLNIILDGTLVNVITLTSSNNTYEAINGITDNNVHHVLITKRTEPLVGIVSFQGIILSGGSLQAPPAPLTRKIEFIGDSITCGFGNQGIAGCNFSPPTENNYYTYESLIAQAVQAQLFVEAWSGKGVIRNCCDQNITTPDPLPSYYDLSVANSLGSATPDQWNFTQYVPDAVVINLGTNDYSTPPQPPQDLFVNAYIEFVQTIESKYAPAQPKFFLVCGPMIGNPCCEYVQAVATKVNATYVDLTNLLTYPFDYGCDGHPSTSGHYKMAEKALPTIQQVMGWTS